MAINKSRCELMAKETFPDYEAEEIPVPENKRVDWQAKMYAKKIIELANALNHPELYLHFVLKEGKDNRQYLISRRVYEKMNMKKYHSTEDIEKFMDIYRDEVNSIRFNHKGLYYIALVPRSGNIPAAEALEINNEVIGAKEIKYNPMNPDKLDEILSRSS